MELQKIQPMNESFTNLSNALTASLASRAYTWKQWSIIETFDWDLTKKNNVSITLAIDIVDTLSHQINTYYKNFKGDNFSASQIMLDAFNNTTLQTNNSLHIELHTFQTIPFAWKPESAGTFMLLRNSHGFEAFKKI